MDYVLKEAEGKQLRIKNYEFEPLRFFGIKPCKLSFFRSNGQKVGCFRDDPL
jgi:hypothetical protein